MQTPVDFIRKLTLNPVRGASHASRRNVLRAQACDNRLQRLPPSSQLRFVVHAAADSTPARFAANNEMEVQGFLSFRQLVPILQKEFGDIWPSDS